jgi:hypothetical protein
MSLHTKGLALIDAGRIAEGLPLMDEAMAAVVAGDLSPYFTGIIYCALIGACLELSDVRRAGEWSDAAREWCESLPSSAPFPGMCRVNRAEVARLRGLWTVAEAEAVRATDELEPFDPGLAASALVQVGEIRRRMGDLTGAEQAFARAQELGGNPQPGMALLRLARGKVEPARTAPRLALAGEHSRSAQRLSRDVYGIAAGARRRQGRGRRAATIAAEERTSRSAGPPAMGDAAFCRGRRPPRSNASATPPRRQELRLPYDGAARALYGGRCGGGDEEGAGEPAAARGSSLAAPDADATAGSSRPGGASQRVTARESGPPACRRWRTNRDIASSSWISDTPSPGTCRTCLQVVSSAAPLPTRTSTARLSGAPAPRWSWQAGSFRDPGLPTAHRRRTVNRRLGSRPPTT